MDWASRCVEGTMFSTKSLIIQYNDYTMIHSQTNEQKISCFRFAKLLHYQSTARVNITLRLLFHCGPLCCIRKIPLKGSKFRRVWWCYCTNMSLFGCIAAKCCQTKWTQRGRNGFTAPTPALWAHAGTVLMLFVLVCAKLCPSANYLSVTCRQNVLSHIHRQREQQKPGHREHQDGNTGDKTCYRWKMNRTRNILTNWPRMQIFACIFYPSHNGSRRKGGRGGRVGVAPRSHRGIVSLQEVPPSFCITCTRGEHPHTL